MRKLSSGTFSRPQSLICCRALLALALLLAACKSAPVPPPVPQEVEVRQPPPLVLSPPSLVFDSIQAENPNDLTLFFNLGIENPFPAAGQLKIESWQVEINGQTAHSGFSLEGAENSFFIESETSALFPLTLNMDVPALIAANLAPADDYEIKLTTALNFSGERIQVSGLAAFPGVRPPVFSIIDIAIIKAELINTRFRVGMTIDNPNPFPLVLSSFGYELYGNGRFWADGIERNNIQIPAKSSVEGNLLLLMNFMGMRRTLLDQIINLVDVNYRFTGEAQVSTGIDYLPTFVTRFELSGFSQVLEE